MQFETLSEFLQMDGHGFYVWLAYGATLGFLLIYPLVLRARNSKIVAQIQWAKAADNYAQDAAEELD